MGYYFAKWILQTKRKQRAGLKSFLLSDVSGNEDYS